MSTGCDEKADVPESLSIRAVCFLKFAQAVRRERDLDESEDVIHGVLLRPGPHRETNKARGTAVGCRRLTSMVESGVPCSWCHRARSVGGKYRLRTGRRVDALDSPRGS